MITTQTVDLADSTVVPFKPYLAYSAPSAASNAAPSRAGHPHDFVDAMRAVEREFYDL